MSDRKFWILILVLILLWLAPRPGELRVVYAQATGGRIIRGTVQSVAPPDLAFTQRFDYDGSGNAIYIGMADSATGSVSTGAAIWSISKVTYNGSNQATVIQWPGGSSKANQIWDNRAALSYQ